MKNKIYFGDNLQIMQKLSDRSIDLIITDPPFNSGINYNLPGSEITAFTDIWTWNETAISTRDTIEKKANRSKIYNILNRVLIGYDHVLNFAVKGPEAQMRSYLVFIGIRLAEMYRLLKDTGSIYLHCDSSASHYLKTLMDSIFGSNNFRREIIWSLQNPSGFKTLANNWIRNHDIILYYTKTSEFTFNKQYKSYDPDYLKKFKDQDEQGSYRLREGGRKQYMAPGIVLSSVWSDIQSMQSQGISAKEGLGYPTQKPRILYERIIKASSNEQDIVLDPFIGSGTTLDASHRLNRRWIGIDITDSALELTQSRLLNNCNLLPNVDYEFINDSLKADLELTQGTLSTDCDSLSNADHEFVVYPLKAK